VPSPAKVPQRAASERPLVPIPGVSMHLPASPQAANNPDYGTDIAAEYSRFRVP
jgi:hypothetical protein